MGHVLENEVDNAAGDRARYTLHLAEHVVGCVGHENWMLCCRERRSKR